MDSFKPLFHALSSSAYDRDTSSWHQGFTYVLVCISVLVGSISPFLVSLCHLLCFCLHLNWLLSNSADCRYCTFTSPISSKMVCIKPLCDLCLSSTLGASRVSSGHLSCLLLQWSYTEKVLRLLKIEPWAKGWEARFLPMCYTSPSGFSTPTTWL